jgi:xylulokinase
MKKDKVALGKIIAISGSGQQHGSVYFNEKAGEALANLDPKKTLVENLRGVFTRKTSPIWMDSSTAADCMKIRKQLGGIQYTATRTGSDTFERFTGPQIRKFYKTEPEAYTQTASIALVSSFMASLLSGKIAPIDFGDGAGMNLMDIRKKKLESRRAQGHRTRPRQETAAARGFRPRDRQGQPLFHRQIRPQSRSPRLCVDRR